MQPIGLGSNQPKDRFYRGGARIADFRGEEHEEEFQPEDWVASCTEVAGEPGVGLTRLPDGRLLRDAIAESAEQWLGPEHHGVFGTSTELLTKLLDAGERLPVHVHPDDAFAQECLGGHCGKAEAWLFLTDSSAHLGLLPGTTQDEIHRMIAEGESETAVARMHRIEVRAGDVVYCPPGVPHAIGEGSFLVEIQQPSDLSIFLEWRSFPLPGGAGGHLGVSDEQAAGIVQSGMEASDVDALRTADHRTRGDLLHGAEAPFRLERLGDGDPVEQGYSVLFCLEGSGELATSGNVPLPLAAGSTILIPWAAGEGTLRGDDGLEVVIARPPRPSGDPASRPHASNRPCKREDTVGTGATIGDS